MTSETKLLDGMVVASLPPSPTIMHDPWLTTREASPLADMAASLNARLEGTSRRNPKRKPRWDAAQRRLAIVQNLVANLAMLAFRHQPGTRLAVQAHKQAVNRYDREELPRGPLITTLKLMAEQGLVHYHQAVFKQLRTTIEPAPQMRAMLAGSGAALGDISRAPGGETIILKAVVGRGRPKVLVDYSDTVETLRLRAEMGTINAALARSDIRLCGSRPPPDQLVRVFLIGSPEAPASFDGHGRLFRGFWEFLPRAERAGITINGERVVELDYRAMYVHLAYALLGAGLPGRDPYDIPGLERHRDAVKKAVASLFFREGALRRLAGELRELLPEGWTASRLTAAVAARHPAIAHLFGTNIGPRLANAESGVLVAVLLRLLSEGVVALPIHDCVLVAESNKEAARTAMLQEARRLVGVALPVEEKVVQ
ncbi:hypothetical protein [Mesorhizobium ventifaucium]|uniref:DNA-directed DNA polymerase family A palm domain-containing protein n=1 Tax=Mesorhizobium ventifaucium TaxID=666020 RepID=A0ABM9E900_9HYPH|nr:hypothetical protein [Mesorhizobium ventifaucium]CAH2405266.1 conserved hypothetical protein [Mesorhizobium ventifaucium]